MLSAIRATGAWTQLLVDWLDSENLAAPDIRATLAHWRSEEQVSISAWRDVLTRAVALRPQLLAPGLALGALVQVRHVGVMGYVVLASRNLGEAMVAFQRYERLFYGADLCEIVMDGDEVELRWRKEVEASGLLLNSTGTAALVSFLRKQVDDPLIPSLVSFVNPAPDSAEAHAAYETFFGCPVHFGDSQARVRFSVRFLAIALPHSDPGLREILDRQAQSLLLALPDSSAFDRALQQVILKLLPDGLATLPCAARELCVSVRTLQRRLDARALTWQILLDRTREQLARQYLADHSLSLGDITLLLGFSEQSAFNRAFRRWTGQTPLQVLSTSDGFKV